MIEGFYEAFFDKLKKKDSHVCEIIKTQINTRKDCTECLVGILKMSSNGIDVINKIYFFTDEEILEMMPGEFSDFNSWIIPPIGGIWLSRFH